MYKFKKINFWMSVNASDNDINLLGLVISINVDSKLLVLCRFKSFRF